jgi:hypothetical protein
MVYASVVETLVRVPVIATSRTGEIYLFRIHAPSPAAYGLDRSFVLTVPDRFHHYGFA